MKDFTNRARFLANELGVPEQWVRIKTAMDQSYRVGLLDAAEVIEPPNSVQEWADILPGDRAFIKQKIHSLG